MSYFIRQIGEKDCAITSLKILLANIYKRKDFLFYPQANINEALSLKDVIRIAKNEGVVLSAYRLKKKNEIKELKHKKSLIVIKRRDILHLIYLKNIKRRGVVILDPKIGKVFMKFQDFFEIWNGEVLETVKVNGSNFNIKKKRIIPLYKEILMIAFQIFTYSLFLCGLYFINNTVDFLIPLVLFISFIFSLLLFNYLLINFMKKIDNDLFKGIYRSEGNLKEKYLKITKLKTLIFTSPLELISSILLVTFSLIILGINSYLSLIIAFFVLFIQFLLKVISSSYLDYRKNYIENCENNLFLSENEENALSNFKVLNDEVYKFITLNNLKKFLLILIIIVGCLFLCSFEKEISLNYLLFHVFAIYYISSNFDKILDFNKNYEELNYLKSIYYYYSKTY